MDSHFLKPHLAQAFPDLLHELTGEIKNGGGRVVATFGDLIIYENLKYRPLWAQFVGTDPQFFEFASISDGAKHLLALQKRWCSQSVVEHRRAELIQEKVFRYKIPELEFLNPVPQHQWGFWSLIDKNRMVYCAKIDTPLPLGEVRFAESDEPPSRAYLKLWEVMTCHGVRLQSGENVVDLGACPGGWTWVLSEVGCSVTAVDKAPIDPKIESRKNVRYLKKDAFKMSKDDIPMPTWVFSDVICYPKDLLELVEKWMAFGVERFVCTLKFKGDTDWDTIRKFQGIANSRLVHLCANKHELTFIKF